MLQDKVASINNTNSHTTVMYIKLDTAFEFEPLSDVPRIVSASLQSAQLLHWSQLGRRH